MKQILLTLCVFIAFITSAYAGEYYNCVGKDGNTVLTTTPQDGMKCEMKGEDDNAVSGGNNSACKQINKTLDSFESKSSYAKLLPVEREQQTELLEELCSCDAKGALRRINNILDSFESKSRYAKLLPIEREQQTELLRLKASLFSGKTDNQSDTAKKIMRQQKKMESEMDAARARQNAEMQRQQMDIWDLQNKQRMQEWKKNY